MYTQYKKFIPVFVYGLILIFLLMMQSCDVSDTFQPKGDYITGYAGFVGTNYMSSPGYYAIALYSCQGSPLNSVPVKTDSLNISTGVSPFWWRINYSEKNNFYLAVVWKRSSSEHEIPIILGIYGCDTCHTCSNYKVIAFPNFTGADYNITCWADSTKKLN